MAREDPQLKVRMPEELHRRVVDAARENGRSLNAEIVTRLQSSFPASIFAAGNPPFHTAEFARQLVDALTTIVDRGEGKLILNVVKDVDVVPSLQIDVPVRTPPKLGNKAEGSEKRLPPYQGAKKAEDDHPETCGAPAKYRKVLAPDTAGERIVDIFSGSEFSSDNAVREPDIVTGNPRYRPKAAPGHHATTLSRKRRSE